MITIVNLTPHVVTVNPGDGQVTTFPPSGMEARVRELVEAPTIITTDQGDVPVHAIQYADLVDDMPAPADGVRYLVSRVTAAAVPRADLVFPQWELRDAAGRILGCRALGTFHKQQRGFSA